MASALSIFHRKIDKYVDDAGLARLEAYVSVPCREVGKCVCKEEVTQLERFVTIGK